MNLGFALETAKDTTDLDPKVEFTEELKLLKNEYGFECKLQAGSAHDSSRMSCIHYKAFYVSAMRNDRRAIYDYRLGNRRFKVISRSALVTRKALVQSYMDWCIWWCCERFEFCSARLRGSGDTQRHHKQH